MSGLLPLLPLVLPDLDGAIVAALLELGHEREPAAYRIPLNGDGVTTRIASRSIALPPGAAFVVTEWGVTTSVTGLAARDGMLIRIEPDERADRRLEMQQAIDPYLSAPIVAARSIKVAFEMSAANQPGSYLATTGNSVLLSGYLVRSVPVLKRIVAVFGEAWSRVLVPNAADPVSLIVADRALRVDRLAFDEPIGSSASSFVVRLGDMQFPREANADRSPYVWPAQGLKSRNRRNRANVTGSDGNSLRMSPVHLERGDLVEMGPYAISSWEADGSAAFLHVQGAAW